MGGGFKKEVCFLKHQRMFGYAEATQLIHYLYALWLLLHMHSSMQIKHYLVHALLIEGRSHSVAHALVRREKLIVEVLNIHHKRLSFNEVKSSQVKSSQVKSSQVKPSPCNLAVHESHSSTQMKK